MNNSHKRIFVGIPIRFSDNALLKIEEISIQSKHFSAKWVSPVNYHFTISFIGETPVPEIPKIIEILHQSTENQAKFNIQLMGLGAFPSYKNAKVFWIGTEHNAELTGLAKQIQQNLAQANILPFPEKFVAHLTLARFYVPPKAEHLKKLITQYSTQNFGHIAVNHFCLYESVFQNNSVTYATIQQFNLL